ncbi:MAG: hypothetical protein MUF21_00790 [Gemmatimonadaceae bacterium]|nr:hypothetical protein [Gemmatimonadaceae bacterium]
MVSRVPRLVLVTAAALLAACGDGSPTVDTGTLDQVAPRASTRRATSPDSIFAFTVTASDNLGIKYIRAALSGAITTAVTDTFRTAVTQTEKTFAIDVPRSVPSGAQVQVVVQVEDGNNNLSKPDTVMLAVGNRQPGFVSIVSPATGTQAVRGRPVVLAIAARATNKLRAIGYSVQAAPGTPANTPLPAIPADSQLFSSPLRDSTSVNLTMNIPATAAAGPVSILPFLVDSLGQRSAGAPIILDVLASGGGATIPRITRFGVTDRIEARDTAFVEAQDAVGIGFVGYEFRTMDGVRVTRDSQPVAGAPTSVPVRLDMRTTTPRAGAALRLQLRFFARNSEGRVTDSTTAPIDTVVLVSGTTRPLPNGGQVADGYYHDGTRRLYLTNIERNQVEVFNFDSLNFIERAIPVGSRPWGIAPMPQTRGTPLGAVRNQLIVANSGGTNLSIVDVDGSGGGSESNRYLLPNIIAYKVSRQGAGITREIFDFSDRPQFIGATLNPAGDVIVAYSTTPTGGQAGQFANKGTIRWENISRRTSHLFYEHATFLKNNRGDTLEVERRASGGFGTDQTLVPFPFTARGRRASGRDTVDVSAAMIVDLTQVGFRDTTFVRNSASFRRVIFGEGGPTRGSRVLSWDADPGLQRYSFQIADTVGNEVIRMTSDLAFYDGGISPPGDVSDLIANAFSSVQGVAISADGEMAALRADSTYLFNSRLRLYGTLQTSGGNPGFDFHPLFAPGPTLQAAPLQNRLTFAASREPVLEIYDTQCFQRVGVIAIRDPIIGPVKSAVRAGRIILVGATVRGVVVLELDPTQFRAAC